MKTTSIYWCILYCHNDDHLVCVLLPFNHNHRQFFHHDSLANLIPFLISYCILIRGWLSVKTKQNKKNRNRSRGIVSKMTPKGYDEKNTKKLISCLGPNTFLNKNNCTFRRQTFHFFSESILIFFIFDQKRPKITVLNFRFFIKKT